MAPILTKLRAAESLSKPADCPLQLSAWGVLPSWRAAPGMHTLTCASKHISNCMLARLVLMI